MFFKVLIENVKLIIAVAFFCIVVVIVAFFMNSRVKVIFNEIVENQVKENASSIADLFSEKLYDEYKELKKLSAILGNTDNDEDCFELLGVGSEKDVSLGIFDLKDKNYLSPGILNSFRGHDSVSYNKITGLTFSVPIYSGQNVKSVLYRNYSASTLEEKFSVKSYGDNGLACVIKSNGDIVIPFRDLASPLVKVYDSNEIQKAFVSIRHKMFTSSSAAVYFKHMKTGYYLFEAEILNSEFRIMGLITEKSVYRGLGKIQYFVLWVVGILFIFMAIGLCIVVIAEKKSKQVNSERMEALAKSEAKGFFLANMSHEIRTPLNAILGLNDIILRESSEAGIKDYAGKIKRSSETLLSIINDVLDFSKMESGKLEIRNSSYHLQSVINDASMIIAEKLKQKNLSFKKEIDYELPDELIGDEVRIKQILINLLNNSIKYTERGIVSLIIFGEIEYDELNLHFVIKDTGIGIKKEVMPFLFNSFSRVDEDRNKYIEGTGLGLAIVKQLVEMMDGSVKVRSAYGVGSEFEVIIPQKIIGNKTLKDSESSMAGISVEKELSFISPDANLVLVDDNEVNLLVTEKLLAPTLINIKSFSDPASALEYLREQKVDLILLDDLMPGMNGVDLLRKLKIRGAINYKTPCIALTANAMAGSREMYLRAGFDSYLSKPVASGSLMKTIHELLPKELVTEEEIALKNEVCAGEVDNVKRCIDKNLGLSYCAGSEDIYRTILNKYIEIYDSKKQRISDALHSKDWNELMVEIHSLKSSSLSIGAKVLSDEAKEMELVLRDIVGGLNIEDNINFVQNNIERIVCLYDNVMEEARKI